MILISLSIFCLKLQGQIKFEYIYSILECHFFLVYLEREGGGTMSLQLSDIQEIHVSSPIKD